MIAVLGCGGEEPGEAPSPPTPGEIAFTEVTEAAGVTHIAWCGSDVKNHLLESDGTGCALFDYDGDGDLDLYIVSAWKIEGRNVAIKAKNALYRNDGDFRFTDVTKASGAGDTGWGCGVIVGDYDNDGHLDLYVTNFGPNALLRNRGDGTFTNVTQKAGVGDPRWSSCATFFDADGDGDLDLYVTNYVRADWEEIINAERTLEWKGIKVMAGPVGLPGERDIYYRNRGDGTFEDFSKQAGLEDIGEFFGYTATATDYDNDGDVDLYVANDSNPNFCYRNDGKGNFTDVGGFNGSALSGNGDAQAGMGVDAGDVNGDLFMDIVVANFAEDVVTLYKNEGDGFFEDFTSRGNLTGPTFQPLSWGVDLFDYDNDGDLDLTIANGHIYPQADMLRHKFGGYGFRAKNQLFENSGKGRFTEITLTAGPGFAVEKASHGVATGDIDNDGDLDLVFVNVDSTPTILRNDGGNARPWLIVDLKAPPGRNLVMNAKVLVTAGGVTQVREIRTGSSYASHNDLRAHFGLGASETAEKLEVVWADGSRTTRKDVPARQILAVTPTE